MGCDVIATLSISGKGVKARRGPPDLSSVRDLRAKEASQKRKISLPKKFDKVPLRGGFLLY